MKKYNYFQKLTIASILALILLSGCGGSENLPKIVNLTYSLENNQLIVEATDDAEIVGYIVMYTQDEPKLENALWQESNIVLNVKPGTLYVWVRDNDNNLAYSEIVVESALTMLSKEYEFLQWYLDDSIAKTVDGVAYDLASLKQEYGDLYRFIEPLSKEEVEYRFLYLAEYFADQAEKGVVEDTPAGLSSMPDLVFTNFVNTRKNSYEKLSKGNLPELSDFSKYYYYLEKTKNYYSILPKSLLVNDELYNQNLIQVIESASFEDKNWFVRDYMSQVDYAINAYIQENVEMRFIITNNQITK